MHKKLYKTKNEIAQMAWIYFQTGIGFVGIQDNLTCLKVIDILYMLYDTGMGVFACKSSHGISYSTMYLNYCKLCCIS